MLEPTLLLGAVVYALIEAVKALLNGDYKSAGTTAAVWFAGIAVVFVAANSTLGGGITVAGVQLNEAKLGDLVLIGMQASSLFATTRSLTRNFGVKAASIKASTPIV
jgi:predicted Co/Zn/Cd cation transporter (cation efflux family)